MGNSSKMFKVETLRPLPEAIAGTMMAELPSGDILVTGGNGWENDRKFWSNRSHLYSVNEKTWRAGPLLPKSLGNALCVKAANQWIIFGGANENGVNDSVFLLSVENAPAWKNVGTTPFCLVHGAAAADGTRIYFVGGTPSATVATVGLKQLWLGKADPCGLIQWQPGPDFPGQAVSIMSAALWQRKFFVFGGYTEQGCNTDQAFSYDLKGGWKPLAPLPYASRASTVIAMENGIVIIGGWIDKEAIPHVWFYQPETNQYEQLSELPVGIAVASGLYSKSAIYLAGNEDRIKHRSPNAFRLHFGE